MCWVCSCDAHIHHHCHCDPPPRIYDQSKLHQMLVSKGKDSAPEFFDPPSCPFYTIPLGSLSPYGAELHAMLRFLAQPERLESSRPRHASLDGAQWAAALGRHFSEVYSGYKNKSVKTVVANLALGKTYPETGDSSDSQANSLCKVTWSCELMCMLCSELMHRLCTAHTYAHATDTPT